MAQTGTTLPTVFTTWSWAQQPLESPGPWVSEAQEEMGRQVKYGLLPSTSFQMGPSPFHVAPSHLEAPVPTLSQGLLPVVTICVPHPLSQTPRALPEPRSHLEGPLGWLPCLQAQGRWGPPHLTRHLCCPYSQVAELGLLCKGDTTLWKSWGHGHQTLEAPRAGKREVVSLLGSLVLSEGRMEVPASGVTPPLHFQQVKSRSQDPVAGERQLLRGSYLPSTSDSPSRDLVSRGQSWRVRPPARWQPANFFPKQSLPHPLQDPRALSEGAQCCPHSSG